MKFTLPYYILLISVLLWCALIIMPPVISHFDSSSHLSSHLYKMFSPVCHQYESHSLHLFGYKLAVCERCLAIYVGFLLGVILFPKVLFNKPFKPVKLWVIFTLPMVVDVLLNAFNIHDATVLSRLITGFFFGAGASNILTPIIIEAISEIINKIPNEGVQYVSKT